MTLYQEVERMCRERGVPESLIVALANQAVLLLAMGRPREALPRAEEAYEVASRHGLTMRAREIGPLLGVVRSEVWLEGGWP